MATQDVGAAAWLVVDVELVWLGVGVVDNDVSSPGVVSGERVDVANVVEAVGVEAPGVEIYEIGALDVEAPGVEAPGVEAPGVEEAEVDEPAPEQLGQSQHAWSLHLDAPADAEKPALWREELMKEHWNELREESYDDALQPLFWAQMAAHCFADPWNG